MCLLCCLRVKVQGIVFKKDLWSEPLEYEFVLDCLTEIFNMIEYQKCLQILKINWNSENSQDHGFFLIFSFFLLQVYSIVWCWGLRSITSIMAKLSALLFICLTILFDQVKHTIAGNGETFEEPGQRNYEEDEDGKIIPHR